MAHLALYREFRPQRFSEVIGQEHITRTLKNALTHQRLHHAYLLSGPRGTGKTTVARLIAKAANCLNLTDGEPCNECEACRSILGGETLDVIEIDAASNRGIEEIRDLREKVKYAPAELRYKVYIIDEVHMLSEPAFNALLKTLEEPPDHVLFVLATTEKQKLPVTIVSRCQGFDYHRLSVSEICNRLVEVCRAYKVEASTEAVTAIARQAEGGMRDALSLLDQVMSYVQNGRITLDDTLHVLGSAPVQQFLQLDALLKSADAGAALLLLNDLILQGKDLRQFVRDFLGHLRDLLLVKVSAGSSVIDLPDTVQQELRQHAGDLDQSKLLEAIKMLAQLESDLRFAAAPRILIEVALIRMAGLFPEPSQVEKSISARPPAVPPSPAIEGSPPSTKPAPPPPADLAPPPSAGPEGETGSQGREPSALWEQVLDLVKRARPSTHAIVGSARLGPVRGKVISIVAANATMANLLKRPADMAILEKAFARLGFAGYEVQPVGPDDSGGNLSAQPASPPPPGGGSQSSLADIARSVFPSDLVQEIEEEGS